MDIAYFYSTKKPPNWRFFGPSKQKKKLGRLRNDARTCLEKLKMSDYGHF